MNNQQLWYVEEFYGGKWQFDTFGLTLEEARKQLANRVKEYPTLLWRIRRVSAIWDNITAAITTFDN